MGQCESVEVMVNTFDRHDFSFKSGPMPRWHPLITGLGYDWAIKQTAKCIGELIALVRPDARTADPTLFNRIDQESCGSRPTSRHHYVQVRATALTTSGTHPSTRW